MNHTYVFDKFTDRFDKLMNQEETNNKLLINYIDPV